MRNELVEELLNLIDRLTLIGAITDDEADLLDEVYEVLKTK
jgi:hypothetical protein